jgi:hypothetical protein
MRFILRGELLENVVQALALRNLHLERMIVGEQRLVGGEIGGSGPRAAQIEHERFRLELAQHVRHGVALDDAPALDDGDVAAQILRFFQVVRGQDDGRPLIVDLAEEVPHRPADLDVDAGGRLVEDQKPRFVHQRARDHEAPLHSARERACDGIAAVPELQLLQVFLRALLGKPPRNAVEARLVHDDREHRLEHVEVDFLRHDADAGLRQLELAVEVVSEHLDRAAGLVDERGDDADRGRLARAVRTQEREEIALRHGEVDTLECLDAVFVDLGELSKDEGVHRSRVA